jgi:type I restriction enzyme S subunit
VMAVWSIVSASSVQSSFGRFDAEFYRPENIDAYNKITSQKHELLGRLAKDGYRVVYENTKILPDEHRTSQSARFLQATNISADGLSIDSKNIGYVSESDWIRYPKGRIQPGELLIEVKGQAEKVAIVPYDFPERTLVSGSLFKLNIESSKINPWYVFSYFSTRYGKLLRDRLKTNTLIGFVSKPQLYRIPIFIPESFADQESIASLSEKAFSLSIESEKTFNQAQQLLKSELGLDNLRFDKPVGYTAQFSELELSRRADPEYFNPVAASIISKITEFEHIKLGSSFAVNNGFPWRSEKFLSDNSGEPVVRIRNIRPTHIDVEELTSIDSDYAQKVGFPRANKGEIVVGMDGIKYFYASVLEGDCYVNQRVAHLKQLSNARISSEYATFIINSRVGQAQLLRDMTIATTVGHITNRNIRKLVIPYISDEFHDNITSLVRISINKKQESKHLLEQAKSRVEQLIEEAVQA